MALWVEMQWGKKEKATEWSAKEKGKKMEIWGLKGVLKIQIWNWVICFLGYQTGFFSR